MLVHLNAWQCSLQHGALGGSWAGRGGELGGPGFITAAKTNSYFMPKNFI